MKKIIKVEAVENILKSSDYPTAFLDIKEGEF